MNLKIKKADCTRNIPIQSALCTLFIKFYLFSFNVCTAPSVVVTLTI